jgi:polyhydroxyalkanoate synthesis regulator phasin
MIDLFKRMILSGLDTQAKVVDFLDEMVKKGKIDEADRVKFVDELAEKFTHGKEKSEEFINELIGQISLKNPFASKAELVALSARIDKLTDRVKKLEQKPKPKKAG